MSFHDKDFKKGEAEKVLKPFIPLVIFGFCCFFVGALITVFVANQTVWIQSVGTTIAIFGFVLLLNIGFVVFHPTKLKYTEYSRKTVLFIFMLSFLGTAVLSSYAVYPDLHTLDSIYVILATLLAYAFIEWKKEDS